MRRTPTSLGASSLLVYALFAACASPSEPSTEPDPDPDPVWTVPTAAAEWLGRTAIPFDGVSIDLPHDDLEPLRDLVGDARIVSLGENTHGTREFFQMKARTLRFLVEEMGFDAFAIEATWPEAYRLDRYVRTGEGDPASLIAGLYFWTWTTEAVLEMVEWMRQYNEAGGDLGFYGFDMQYPGMAIHNVEEYVGEVDPSGLAEIEGRLECLRAVANGPSGSFVGGRFEEQSGDYQTDCLEDLSWIESTLTDRRDAYVAASSDAAFEHALWSARVARQYPEMWTEIRSRDAAMADNVEWLMEHQLGADDRIVLWAHNLHVGYGPGWMGRYLRPAFGDDMVVMGFTHERGAYTGFLQEPGRLGTATLDSVRDESYEAYFGAVDHGRFFLDLRPAYSAGDSATWLAGPRTTRIIGCCWDASRPNAYWSQVAMPDWFDVVIHISATGPTRLLSTSAPTVF